MNIYIDVESSGDTKRVLVEEENLIIESCHPKILRKDLQTKSNLIVTLRPYITGEMITKQDEMPLKQSRKSKLEQKQYGHKRQKLEEEIKLLEYAEEEEEEELEVVPPGGQISFGILTSKLNKIRENIVRRSLHRSVNSSISQ